MIVVIFILSLSAYSRESNAREEQFREEQREDNVVTCQQRVAGRDDVRIVFLNIYEYIDEQGGESAELRAILERVFPSIKFRDCMRQFENNTGEALTE